jgi:hypothetical protein
MYHKGSSEHLFLVNITKSVNFSKTPTALTEHLVYSDMDGSLDKVKKHMLNKLSIFKKTLHFKGKLCKKSLQQIIIMESTV